MEEGKCPIWGTPATPLRSDNTRNSGYWSARTGGAYKITYESLLEIRDGLFADKEKAKLTTWMVDQRRTGNECPIVTRAIIEQIIKGKNLTISQKKHRFFSYLEQKNLTLSSEIDLDQQNPEDKKFSWIELHSISAWIEAIKQDDTTVFLRMMQSEGLINFIEDNHRFSLTSSGFTHMEQLNSEPITTNKVFVAMWFGSGKHASDMLNIYNKGIKLGIQSCELGLEALRIDEKPHNGKIDSEIIIEIQNSKFIIADFTCFDPLQRADIRAGVYYEAGLAHGFGLEVIFCCHKNSFDGIHFDIRQSNFIVWETPEELAEKLKQRIRATFNPNKPRP